MKKILIILNGANAPLSVMSSAIEIAKADNATLHALFLLPAVYKPTLAYPFVLEPAVAGPVVPGTVVEREDQIAADKNIRLFANACTAANVPFHISPGGNTSFDELVHHSAFSDLIIADAKADFPETPSLPVTISLRDLLVDAHCPVLLLQEEIKQPEQVILSYDGSFSSVHAIKMFSYIFPSWRSVPTCLLSISTKENAPLPYEEYIKDWLAPHFSQLTVELLKGEPKKELAKAVKSRGNNILVVMGAYGRTAVSRLFRRSLSGSIINETSAALFIAHEGVNT